MFLLLTGSRQQPKQRLSNLLHAQVIFYHSSSQVKSSLLHPQPLKQRIMARDAVSSGTAVDRISNMPRNIIDLILERLSIHEAAIMGVLSKTWRDIWATNPHLVFDGLFFATLSPKKFHPDPSKNSRIISNILLAHSGPILNFILYIPRYSLLNRSLDKDLWIKNLSNKRVRNLKLINLEDIRYKIPSSLFSCLDLTHLNLFSCILNPPRRFGGFCNLIKVELVHVKITADISFGTQLEELALSNCTGIEHLRCQFKHGNNLTLLKIIDTGEFDLGWFECVQKVTNLSLTINVFANSRIEIINLDKLFGSMPRINTLYLCGFSLESLEPGAAVSERPRTTLENLYLDCVGFHDLDHMQYVLCLIKSFPNLRYLNISLEPKVNSNDDMDLMALWGDMILNQLESVEIQGIVGTRPEFQFVQVLLASTPSLRLLKLNKYSTIDFPRIDDLKEELRIARALLLFPRASRSAQVIWA
ncbi:hypothetical protein POM88_042244 [Heracleum sosnowskyi]|uniref:F-box domain-containing protein n=1 Tax=Heracleum sosnowskyi TaxID=360622 RepID=A0AAD8HHE4_9APIA|nr:hypothetical protein POM88_042244 [Heracleum sosnowskyi]